MLVKGAPGPQFTETYYRQQNSVWGSNQFNHTRYDSIDQLKHASGMNAIQPSAVTNLEYGSSFHHLLGAYISINV